MVSPSNPSQDGNSEVLHDGMDDAGHEEQANRADGGSVREEDSSEGSSEETSEEKKDEKDEDDE